MRPAQSAALKRRQLLEQSLGAVFGLRASLKPLRAVLTGPAAVGERAFLLARGMADENIAIVAPEKLAHAESLASADFIFAHLPCAVSGGSYAALLDLLQTLKERSAGAPRLFLVEAEVPGTRESVDFGHPELSLRQIYLDVLQRAEDKLGREAYVRFHERLLAERSEELHTRRLAWMAAQKELAGLFDEPAVRDLMLKAALRFIAEMHAAKTFEAGLIAGRDAELEKLQHLLMPRKSLKDFMAGLAVTGGEELLKAAPLKAALREDAVRPFEVSALWHEFEKLAGRYLDSRCGRAFNLLTSAEQVELTGEARYARKDPPRDLKPELATSFRKFAIEDDPLAGLLGRTMPAVPQLARRETLSLEGYGEVFLAMLSAWCRGRVNVGGVLYSYAYLHEERHTVLGSSVFLAEDRDLFQHVEKLAAALDLPDGRKAQPQEVLKAFFQFNRHYLSYFERVRAMAAPFEGFHLGDLDTRTEPSAAPAVAVMSPERQERLAAVRARRLRITAARAQRASKRERPPAADAVAAQEAPEPAAEDAGKVREELEAKRRQLVERLAERERAELEIEEQRRKRREEQERRKKELEEQIKLRREQERIEKQKRQEKLAEEKQRREEVRQRRIESLKNAFDVARQTAQQKQEAKLAKKAAQGEPGGKKKKEVNTAAVKMMIRFGTENAAIMTRTGLTEEQIEALRQEVQVEDGKVRGDA